MSRCRLDFIRKWGDWIQNDEFQFPVINPKYNIGIILSHSSIDLLRILEPWCSTIYVDETNDVVLRDNYIRLEQPNTSFNLLDRVKLLDDEKNNEILVTIDGNKFTQQDLSYIQNLSSIIAYDDQLPEEDFPCEFELGNLKIEIIQMENYINELVNL